MKRMTRSEMKAVNAGGVCGQDYLGCMWDYAGEGTSRCCIRLTCPNSEKSGLACGDVEWYFAYDD